MTPIDGEALSSVEEKKYKDSSRRNDGVEIEEDIPIYLFDVLLTERKSRLAVKFSTKDGDIFVQSFAPETDYDYIRSVVAKIIQVKPQRLKFQVRQLKLTKYEELEEFKRDPYEALPCPTTSKDFVEKLLELCEYEELVIPDYSCVTVKDSVTDRIRCVPVQIYNRAVDKPWDGGFKDARTGTEYHNAFSQTGPRSPIRGLDLISSRDTQTSWCRNRKLDMPYSRAIQINTNNLFLPCITDRILTPRRYESAEEREERLNVDANIRTIQRYFRAWKMRKCLKTLHEEYQKRKNEESARRMEETEEYERSKKKNLVSLVFPRTRGDFGMLYAIAERWKRNEIANIERMYCGPAKIAELALLSDKEVQVFKVIQKIKRIIKRDSQKQHDSNYLNELGKPTEIISKHKQQPIQIDTIENQKARELNKLYQKVIDKNLSETKKMDALLELKLSLQNDDCELANELNLLIDRALRLLSRGFANGKIQSLQARIDSTMLHHFKQKKCFDFIAVQEEKAKYEAMKKNLSFCQRCGQMKTLKCFSINARTQHIKLCNACRFLDNVVEPRTDLTPFNLMLYRVRKKEHLNGCPYSSAFILQDEDINHLVTQIWHSHSAISESKDIYNLQLVRWRRDVVWSPWNCILLTVEEGDAHIKIEKLDDIYEREFISHIYNKHVLAKKHFKDLFAIEQQFKKFFKNSYVDEGIQ